MRPLTLETPKPLLEVHGRTLLEHQISFLKNRVESIAVTVGYMSEKVAESALQYGSDYIFKNNGGGNAGWLNSPILRGFQSQILIITCDNLMQVDLEGLESETKATPHFSYLVTRESDVGVKGDRIIQSNGRIESISQQENVALLATGLQVLNPGTLSQNAIFESFHDVWSDLIGNNSLFVSQNRPNRWTAIDTPLDLENAYVNW